MKSEHLVRIAVDTPDNQPISSDYLALVIAWGIDRHNEVVGSRENPLDGDHVIDVNEVDASPSLDNAVITDDPENSDPLVLPLGDAFIDNGHDPIWKVG